MESFGEGANILIVKTKEAHALRELSVLWGEEKKKLKTKMFCFIENSIDSRSPFKKTTI